MKRILVSGFAALALAVTGGCAGDDANVDADISADAGGDESVEEYCAFSAELDSRQEKPSDEDMDRIVEIAPEEIKEDVETLATAIKADDQEAEEAVAAGERLEAWEDENCDNDAGGAEGSGEGDADAGGADGDAGDTGDESGTGTDDGQNSGDDEGGSEGGGTGAEVEAEVGDGEGSSTSR